MRNPLDLNNLPEDFARDHEKQPLNDSSPSAAERETETLNRARQLVFGNDNLYQLGSQSMVHGGYQHQACCNMGSALYPTRLFSGASTAVSPPVPPHPHVYTSPQSRHSIAYSSLHPKSQSEKDYLMGHICSSNPHFILENLGCKATPPADGSNNYTCIGAPVGQAFTHSGGSGGGRDMSLSPINRYKDGL